MSDDSNKVCVRNYDREMIDLEEKHKKELHYLKEELDTLRKENEVLKTKWSVVEMIFKK